MPHGVHPWAHSSGCSCHPLELNQPADVVAEVHHANLEPRPHDANGAHNLAAHRVLLLAEYVATTRAAWPKDECADEFFRAPRDRSAPPPEWSRIPLARGPDQ